MGMRNNSFESSNDTVHAETVFCDNDYTIVKDSYALEEAGEGLGGFHRNPDELERDNKNCMVIGMLVVALMLGAAGVYTYSMMPQTMMRWRTTALRLRPPLRCA